MNKSRLQQLLDLEIPTKIPALKQFLDKAFRTLKKLRVNITVHWSDDTLPCIIDYDASDITISGFSDYCIHLYCYIHNVSADMSSSLLQVFVEWFFEHWRIRRRKESAHMLG